MVRPANIMVDDIILTYCPKCDDYYSDDNFHKNKTARGLSSYCKPCSSLKAKEYWKNRTQREIERLQQDVRYV